MATRGVADPPGSDDIVRYYDGTWFDYRVVWTRDHHMHFGYWDDGAGSQAQSLTAMTRITSEQVAIDADERLLDAGCGVGGPALWLARRYGVDVVGITLSEAQVARARRHAAEAGLEDRVRFERRDFTDTGWPDASFDVVWAQESVCHVPSGDKQAFLREAFRLLRPGGRLVMEDWFRPARPLPEADERLLGDWLATWAIADLATVEEFSAWASEAGFVDVRELDLTAGARRSLRRLYRLALVCYPAALALRAVRLRSAVEQANLRGARLQWRAHRRGLWSIRAWSARKPGSGPAAPGRTGDDGRVAPGPAGGDSRPG